MSTDEITVRDGSGNVIYDSETEKFKRLREPFPPEHVGKLPRGKTKKSKETPGTCKPRSEGGDAPDWQDFFCGKYHALPAVHLDYVGHAAATDRLLEVDPFWNWEPVATDDDGRPVFERDRNGNPVGLWIRLTVLDVTRLGYGSVEVGKFDPEKQLIGDALRNAAMRFGVALDMWIKGHADEEDEREAPAAAPLAPLPAGFSSEEESQAAHNEAAALWRTLPEDARPERPKEWPTTREGLDAFNAQINQALATALGASETLDTPPASSEAESGAQGEPELPPGPDGKFEQAKMVNRLAERAMSTPDIGTIQHEPDIEGPSVFNGDTGHCADCGGPIWYDRNHWVHAEESDDVPMHNEVTEPADAGVDVDALYAQHHPVADPKIAELKVKTEVGKMSGPKVIEALTAANLSTAGPPPKLKQRLIEHRLSVLAND